MLVHIVNASNSTFYASYLDEMFRARKHPISGVQEKKDLDSCKIFGIEELDLVRGVEYLLVLSNEGELLEQCRCTPTTAPHFISEPLSRYATKNIELGYGTWEITRYASTNYLDKESRDTSNGFIITGVFEWALTKGIERLVAIALQPLFNFAVEIGCKIRPLGSPVEFEPGKYATATEIQVDKSVLTASRKYFGIERPLTYTAPPQMDYRTIDEEHIRFIDAALNISEPAPIYQFLS